VNRYVRALRPGDIVVLFVVAIGLLAAGLVGASRAEKPPYVDTYSTHDGDRGGFLALRRLLEREGVRVTESTRHPRFLNAERVVVSNFLPYGKVDVDELRDFVAKRGKTLVIVGSDSLDAYARRAFVLPHGARGPEVALTYDAHPIVASPLVAGVSRIVGDGTRRFAHDAFPAAVPLVADAAGAVVLTYSLGRGRIVAVADPTIFTNRLLGKADNARLALSLLGGSPPLTVAFDEFAHGYGRSESAWLVLPGPLRVALIVMGVLCSIALGGSTIRFVPAAAPLLASDPNSAAYLVSLARLLRRGRASTRALADLIDATFAAIARSFGLPAHVDPGTLALLAASRTGAPARIRELAALRARPVVDDTTLLHAAQMCAELRKDLDTDGTQRRASAR